jgi:hypothetical protein
MTHQKIMESGFMVCVLLMVAVTLDLHTLVFDWMFHAICTLGEVWGGISERLAP